MNSFLELRQEIYPLPNICNILLSLKSYVIRTFFRLNSFSNEIYEVLKKDVNFFFNQSQLSQKITKDML